jgi:hypothetical protein
MTIYKEGDWLTFGEAIQVYGFKTAAEMLGRTARRRPQWSDSEGSHSARQRGPVGGTSETDKSLS